MNIDSCAIRLLDAFLNSIDTARFVGNDWADTGMFSLLQNTDLSNFGISSCFSTDIIVSFMNEEPETK